MLKFNKSATLLVIAVVAFVSHIAYKYYPKKRKQNKKEINEVIMFSQRVIELKKSKYSRCIITESMDRLLYYLNSPQYNIDICMYVMTNVDITNAIIKLSYKGIKIRLILDADMAYSVGSSLKRFEKQRIPVRWMKSTNLMHHKFCLIDTGNNCDALPFVIMGSLNWTNQALCGNWENVVVTSQQSIVQQFKEEFERLWVEFKPIGRSS